MCAAEAAPGAWRRAPRRALGIYVLAEGAACAHHAYARRRARGAPPPEKAPADPEYGARFLSLARCDARHGGGAGSLHCARFVRHAFYGAPPEALSHEALASWLRGHLGPSTATDEAIGALEAALGPCAPAGCGVGASSSGSSPAAAAGAAPAAFVFGEGQLHSMYKPLPLRLLLEAQRLLARRRMAAAGFVQRRDPELPQLRYWERDGDGDTPLLVLHGYGRGLASPLFWELLPSLEPALGRRPLVLVDCSWLLVTRVPTSADVTQVPSVRQIASAVARHLTRRGAARAPGGSAAAGQWQVEIDVLAHSFGTAVASALARELAEAAHLVPPGRPAVAVRRVVLMDPMCFIPGITKQAQLLTRMPRDVAAELVEEATPGAPPVRLLEVLSSVLLRRPEPGGGQPADEAAAASERRRWVIFQTYFFFYFVFRDLVYSWVNLRSLQGPDYLDRGHLRALNRHGRLLTVLAETDTMIPAPLLRDDLSAEVPSGSRGGVLWLPTVGHGACQHRADVSERIGDFLAAA